MDWLTHEEFCGLLDSTDSLLLATAVTVDLYGAAFKATFMCDSAGLRGFADSELSMSIDQFRDSEEWKEAIFHAVKFPNKVLVCVPADITCRGGYDILVDDITPEMQEAYIAGSTLTAIKLYRKEYPSVSFLEAKALFDRRGYAHLGSD